MPLDFRCISIGKVSMTTSVVFLQKFPKIEESSEESVLITISNILEYSKNNSLRSPLFADFFHCLFFVTYL